MDNRNIQKKNAGLYVILLLFLIYVGLAVGRVDFHQVTIENFEETIILALTDPWSAPLITKNSVLLTVFLSFLWGLFFLYKMADTRIFMPGREFGTSRLLTAKELNRYTCNFQQPEKNKILSQTARLQYDMQNVNANSVIIGGSGSGKSFYEVKPNLYQCGTSFVVTDPKGELLRDCGGYLEQHGYEVRVLDLIDFDGSDRYNPFRYIHSDEDIIKLITNMMANTTPKESSPSDPFWEHAESMLHQALMSYVWYEFPKMGREANMPGFMEMLNMAKVPAKEGEKSDLDRLMEQLPSDHPARVTYEKVRGGAQDTIRSIFISAHARLAFLQNPKVLRILETDDMDFASFGEGVFENPERKVALFLKIPDNDKSYNFICGMLYTQMFQELELIADKKHKGKLPVHVAFWLDEFANIALPKNFINVLATMRSRNMSANIIIQNIAQIKSMFKDDWESLTGNCDTLVYLGGNEQGTHEYISKLLGKYTIDKKSHGETKGSHGSSSNNYDVLGREILMPDEVRKMDNRRCLIFIKGYDAVMDDKYHTWESKAYLESEQLGPYMSKAEKESLLREGQKRFYLDGGGVTLVKSYVRQIEKYHCIYEESKVFQELEKVRAGNAYLLSHVCYNQTGKLEHLMSVALSVEAKTVKAADGILHAHTIVGGFSKADIQKDWTEENAVFHEMSPKEAAAFFCPENRSLVFGFKKKEKKEQTKKEDGKPEADQ